MNTKYAIEFTCPLLKNKCIGDKCMFWIMDINDHNSGECALVRIAKGLKINGVDTNG